MKTVNLKNAPYAKVTFKLEGYGTILQIYFENELLSSINLLVHYKYISETIEFLKTNLPSDDLYTDPDATEQQQ